MPDSASTTNANGVVAVESPKGRKVEFSNAGPAAYVLGPCVMESRDHALMMATQLRDLADRLGVSVVYKTSFDKANRTSGQRLSRRGS